MGTHAQKVRRALLWMVVCGFLIRAVVATAIACPFFSPEHKSEIFGFEGGQIAAAIVRGEGFSNPVLVPTGPTAWRPPVFPYVMAFFFNLFGTYSALSAALLYALNCLLSAVTSIPIYQAARISFDEQVANWAGWIWAFFPYAIVNSTRMIFDTPLCVLLLAVLLADTLKMRNETRAWLWARHAALWGLGVMAHTGVLVVLPFYWLWLLCQMPEPLLKRVRVAAVGTVVFLACVTPWLVRNTFVFGQFVPFRSNLGLELAVGNQANLEEFHTLELHPNTNINEARRMQKLGEIAYMSEKMAQFKLFVRQYPAEFAIRTVRRFFHYWFSIWEYRPAKLAAKPFETADIPFAGFVTLIALIGLRQLWNRDWLKAIPYALFLGLYPIVFYISHRSYRYRHPVDPFLVILAAAAMVTWWKSRKGLHSAAGPEKIA